MNENTIIQFENISKHFGSVQALREVSFGIFRGECHAILGENGAGKSTLMHILAGMYPQDGGKIILNGKEVKIGSSHASTQLGISIVYQELKLCLNLNAAENIFLGEMPSKFGLIRAGGIYKKTKKILEQFGVDIDINIAVANLGPAQMQLIEIAKAIEKNADILILDEPTSSLTAVEAETLFRILNDLKAKGKTLIFISHRMNEIFAMADRITLMRDGQYIGTYKTEETSEEHLVRMIAGEKLYDALYSAEKAPEKEEKKERDINRKAVLEVRHLNRGKYVQDANFKLYEGEILGLYGLQGAGRTELVETIFGLYGKADGEILVQGQPVTIRQPKDALRVGIGLLTEDRKNRGIMELMNIRENIAVIHGKQISDMGIFVNDKKIDQISNRYVEALSVKTSSIQEMILNLSGGNQQKVVLARMLSTEPRIILADEPTRGVDVGAKAEIFAILNEIRKQGKAVIVISSELQEIVRECDRVLILRNGKIVGEVTDKEIREERILQYAFNG